MKTIIWYRHDLRTTDHEPLSEGSKDGEALGIYCFDPRHFADISYGFPKTDAIRAQFLIESVTELRDRLRKLGSELIVRLGKPEEVLPDVVSCSGADQLFYHGDVAPEETDVQKAVEDNISVPTQKFWGNAMYHRDDLPFDLLTIPDVYTQFRKKVEKKSTVRSPVSSPETLNWADDSEVEPGEIPNLSDLGLTEQKIDDRSVIQFKGGESEAWNRLNHYFYDADELRNYKYTRNGLLGADYSSKFSAWLAHGCISARSIHSEVKKYEDEIHENVSTYWMKF